MSSSEDEDMDVLRGRVIKWVTQGRAEGLRSSRPLCLPQSGWPPLAGWLAFLAAGVAGFKWAESTPPQGAQGSRWSPGGARKAEGAGSPFLSFLLGFSDLEGGSFSRTKTTPAAVKSTSPETPGGQIFSQGKDTRSPR